MVTMGLAAGATSAGCQGSTSVARISQLEVPKAPALQPDFERQRILIRRFTDARTASAGQRIGGGGFVIPGGYRSEHADTYWDQRDRKKPTYYRGWLPSDLPYLLAKSLPGDNVHVADALVDAGATRSWDYVVEGRVLQTRHEAQSSMVLYYLGLLGVPVEFHRYELSYELSLYHATAPDRAIVTRTYEFDERVNKGLYYNGQRSKHLPLRALESTVSDSAADLVREVKRHRARQETVPPSAPTTVPAQSRDST